MKQLKIDVLDMSEIKWTGQGEFWSEDYKVIFSDNERNIT